LSGTDPDDSGTSTVAGFGLALTGGIALEAGPPIMAAGTIRSARALRSGGSDPSLVCGYLTWGLWGGSFITGALDLAGAGGLMYLGSVATGLAQMGINTHHYRAATDVSTDVSPPTRGHELRWSVVPRAWKGHQEIAIVGTL
jgi:hypothetical protein